MRDNTQDIGQGNDAKVDVTQGNANNRSMKGRPLQDIEDELLGRFSDLPMAGERPDRQLVQMTRW